jgi:23S rRNA (cytidine1920-2'-O)/16S rRNA (cytidine1409-2'-O)-methyltransferase
VDVSFISLRLVFLALARLGGADMQAVVLIKPQFEAGRDKVGKKGVVKSPEVHRDVIRGVAKAAREDGFEVLGLTYSPIKGPRGNIEYLAHLGRGVAETAGPAAVDAVVEEANEMLRLL